MPASKALDAPQRSGGRMAPELLNGEVAIAIVQNRAVVVAKDYERVVREVEALQGFDDFADAPVELEDHIASRPQAAVPRESWMRDTGHMDVRGGKVEEKGLLLVLLDKLTAFPVMVSAMLSSVQRADCPPRINPIRLIPFTGCGAVVALAQAHLEQLRVFPAGRFSAHFVHVADLDGIDGVDPDHALVFDIDARHAIQGGGNQERIVETNLGMDGFDGAVPIHGVSDFAKPEMPFADRTGHITGPLEQRWQRKTAGLDDQGRIAGQDCGALLTPGILAGESAYRDGVQVAAAAWPLVKRKPWTARRSIFGVWILVAP